VLVPPAGTVVHSDDLEINTRAGLSGDAKSIDDALCVSLLRLTTAVEQITTARRGSGRCLKLDEAVDCVVYRLRQHSEFLKG
jgi:hypothetical protein